MSDKDLQNELGHEEQHSAPEQTNEGELATPTAVVTAGGESSDNRSNIVWIIISALLAAALVAVLVFPSLRGSSSNETMATVNGIPITKGQLFDQLSKTNGESTLDRMITEELLNQEAKARSITVTDQELDEEINKFKEQVGSEDYFNMLLEQWGATVQDLKDSFKYNLIIYKSLEGDVEVTDEMIAEKYKAYESTFVPVGEQVEASHILVETKEEADKVIERLNGGESFDSLVQELTLDTNSKATNGSVGFFGRDASLVESFKTAAFALKDGETSEPVKSDYGYHIIKRTNFKEATTLESLDKISDDLRKDIIAEDVNGRSEAWIKSLIDKAKIVNNLKPEASAAPSASPTDAAK